MMSKHKSTWCLQEPEEICCSVIFHYEEIGILFGALHMPITHIIWVTSANIFFEGLGC